MLPVSLHALKLMQCSSVMCFQQWCKQCSWQAIEPDIQIAIFRACVYPVPSAIDVVCVERMLMQAPAAVCHVCRLTRQRFRESRVQFQDYVILLLAGACLGPLSNMKDTSLGAAGYFYTLIALGKPHSFLLIGLNHHCRPAPERSFHIQMGSNIM